MLLLPLEAARRLDLGVDRAPCRPAEEKRTKVKKPKAAFPVYEPPSGEAAFVLAYDQGTSIEEIEDQMDDWLEDRRSQKKKVNKCFPFIFPQTSCAARDLG